MTDRCIKKGEEAYPQMLAQIRNAPKQLYVRGRLPSEQKPSVAIIGARRCSSYGREMAEWFAGELAEAGVQIISGMAKGIDGIAQRAACRRDGSSFGVLGCGVDVCYPAENRDLYEMLAEKGGIVSEHPAGTEPLACYFPSRNRIISALSDVVLVIEAKERSGTLITADFALEQGKDVYALPGRLNDVLSCGCNRLIGQGAGIALEPSHILEVLYGKREYREWDRRKGKRGTIKEEAVYTVSKVEKILWDHMDFREITVQELYEKLQHSEEGKTLKLWEITNVLMEMVMKKIISQEQGNKYCRKTGISVSSI